ncbi:MAG: ABC transporter substrate-binding protein [Firmicutes bacterium]|nr:ABC transporter substrate-binding protein [Bacillota bacterium]
MRTLAVSRRWATTAPVALLAFLIMAGFARAQEVQLVVSSYGGAYDEVFKEYIVEPFERENPGVRVVLAPYATVTNLAAQRANPVLDVVQLDDFDIIDAANRGLLEVLRPENISRWDDLYDQAFLKGNDGNVYGLTNVFGAWGIAYNTRHVDRPESWRVFWDPAYRNRVAFMDNWIPDMLMAARAFGGDERDMEPAWRAIADISPWVKQFYPSFSAPQPLLESEEVWLASWFDGRTYALQASGVPVDFAIPKEGGILIRGGLGVVKGSRNRELAEKLIDFAMSVEAQRAFAKNFFYGPTNRRVALEGDLAEKVVYGDADLAQLLVPDWAYILTQRSAWTDRWSRATIW